MSKIHENLQKTSDNGLEDINLPTMNKAESKISAGTVAPAIKNGAGFPDSDERVKEPKITTDGKIFEEDEVSVIEFKK